MFLRWSSSSTAAVYKHRPEPPPCSHDVQNRPPEGDPPGRRRRRQVIAHEPLRHQQVRLAPLPHHRRGVPQQGAGGGRPPRHPADLGHGGSGALPQPPHAVLPRLRLLPAHLQPGRRTELPQPEQLEEGVHVLRWRKGPRQLPLCGAGQQTGCARAAGVGGGCSTVVPRERRPPVLWDERQGCHERRVSLWGGGPTDSGVGWQSRSPDPHQHGGPAEEESPWPHLLLSSVTPSRSSCDASAVWLVTLTKRKLSVWCPQITSWQPVFRPKWTFLCQYFTFLLQKGHKLYTLYFSTPIQTVCMLIYSYNRQLIN